MGRRYRRISIKPVISAFIWGVLIAIGIDPGQMLFETAVSTLGLYLQFAAMILLVIAVYLSYSSLLEAFKKCRSAYRMVGLLGVVAILLAFYAGFAVFHWQKAALALLAAALVWIVAQIS